MELTYFSLFVGWRQTGGSSFFGRSTRWDNDVPLEADIRRWTHRCRPTMPHPLIPEYGGSRSRRGVWAGGTPYHLQIPISGQKRESGEKKPWFRSDYLNPGSLEKHACMWRHFAQLYHIALLHVFTFKVKCCDWLVLKAHPVLSETDTFECVVYVSLLKKMDHLH